jgi:hypothetical protein
MKKYEHVRSFTYARMIYVLALASKFKLSSMLFVDDMDFVDSNRFIYLIPCKSILLHKLNEFSHFSLNPICCLQSSHVQGDSTCQVEPTSHPWFAEQRWW